MAAEIILHKTSIFFALLAGVLFVMLTGCASKITAIADDNSQLSTTNEISESPNHSNIQASDEKSSDVVTLLVYGGWNNEKNMKNEDFEYTLLDEDSVTIMNLFYNHEKETIDSPLSSVATLQFQIGEDYLTTSMDSLGTLSGRINGELVVIKLSESEYEAVYQIISTYAQDIA